MLPSSLWNRRVRFTTTFKALADHLSDAAPAFRAFVDSQLEDDSRVIAGMLGRMALEFAHRYTSVKRFVRALRQRDPERFDVLESAPGEEAQVDFGQGALTLSVNGKHRRPQPRFVGLQRPTQPAKATRHRRGQLGLVAHAYILLRVVSHLQPAVGS